MAVAAPANLWAPKAAEQAAPLAPAAVEETGLTPAFIADLALKLLYQKGQSTAQELADTLCLPLPKIVVPVLDFLKAEHLVEVKGGSGVAAATYQYVISTKGSERAREAMAVNGYTGAAPVTLASYVARVRAQTIGDMEVTPEQLQKALAHLVLPDLTLLQLGPAINSGRSIFLFGPPGTGKSSIANGLASLLQGGMVVPYAILVGQQVIRVFDPSRHKPLVQLDARYDRRWIPVARPFVEVGGELTLEDLDLVFDPATKVHEAPFQMKAAADGRKLEIPFDVLLIFSTNRTPSSLVDEAFLRRIQYKIEVKAPTPQEFSEILKRVCAAQNIKFYPQAADWIAAYCSERKIVLRSCHPRDLMAHLVACARFLSKPADLTPELVRLACETYYVAV